MSAEDVTMSGSVPEDGSVPGDTPAEAVRSGAMPSGLDAILDTAATMFQERGYRNTTMHDLAHGLGITKPTLYARTTGKMEILGAIFDRVLNDLDRILSEATAHHDPRQALEYVVCQQAIHSAQLRSYYQVFYGDQRELPDDLQKLNRARSRRYMEGVRGLVEAGQAAGAIRGDIDPTVVVFTIIGATNWTARWYRADGPLPIATVAEQMSRVLVDGLAAS